MLLLPAWSASLANYLGTDFWSRDMIALMAQRMMSPPSSIYMYLSTPGPINELSLPEQG